MVSHFTLHLKGVSLELNFIIQPIVSRYNIVAYECLSEIKSDSIEAPLDKAEFFSSLSKKNLRDIVIAQVSILNRYAYSLGEVVVSINMPASLILDSKFITRVCTSAKFNLAIEVTDIDIADKELEALSLKIDSYTNNNYAEFWLDDFCLKNFNASIITSLSWKAIKLDKSILESDEILRETIEVCSISQNSHLIFEGVESSEVCEKINYQNQDALMQGYYFGKPRTIDFYVS